MCLEMDKKLDLQLVHKNIRIDFLSQANCEIKLEENFFVTAPSFSPVGIIQKIKIEAQIFCAQASEEER